MVPAVSVVDPRTPVIVGVGPVTQKVDPGEALEPADLMAEAARRAVSDAGGAGVLDAVGSVRVVSLLSRRYPNPAAAVADRLGIAPRQTAVTTMGGNSPQSLVNDTALAVQRGDLDVALLTGAESWRTRMALRKAGTDAGWSVQPEDVPAPDVIGDELVMNAPEEIAKGIVLPVQLYPLFENAVRAAAGRGVEEHSVFISELWARFSEVASRNPYAWVQEAKTAEEIRTPTATNRMVGFPYPKLMNSNNDVDQSAALLVCSVAAAERLGVPPDRWVFPWSGTDAHDHEFVSNRWDLHSSPAIRIAGGRALSLAGVGVDDLAHVDLYSCFPSAVEISAGELGLSLDRPLTVTGGLTFAGGPWNNYVMHSIATMVGLLRDDPSAVGFCSANGGYVTKHAFGVYSATPPASPFRWEKPQDEVDALPRREVVASHDGDVTVESYTVMHERDGSPTNAIAACLLPGGERTWATSTEADVLSVFLTEDAVGRAAKVDGEGTLLLA
jgi:acetyl-CoA C-acetyltransferase